jgi:hypothetical protein
MVHFLTKPIFTWLAAQDDETGAVFLTVSLLSYEKDARLSAEDLRLGAGPVASIPKEARQLLLLADPMTVEYAQSHAQGGPDANPDPHRLVPGTAIIYGGGRWTGTVQHEVQQADMITETAITHRTTTEQAGFLGYFSQNAPQTGSKTITTIQGGSRGTTAGSAITVSVTLETPPGQPIEVQPYYDKIYGTFAFQNIPYGGQPISGSVSDAANRPAARREVRLLAGGREFRTVTDTEGRFLFRSRRLQPGEFTIIVGDRRFPLRFEGREVTGLNLSVSR